MALAIKINWCNYGDYKIIDINEKLYGKVLELVLDYFLNTELFKILKVNEQPNIDKDFFKLQKHILLNDCSIMVVDEKNDIKGVAMLKWMTEEWHSWMDWKLLIACDHLMVVCVMLYHCLEKLKEKDPDNDTAMDSLHVFNYHLCEELENDEVFVQHFFDSICEVARHMHMPRVTYMCFTDRDRAVLDDCGFHEVTRVIYSLFVYKGRRPFDRLRDINEMYASLYERLVEPIQPFQQMIVRHAKAKDPKEGQKKTKEETKA